MEHDFNKMRFEELHTVGIKYSRALKKCETYKEEPVPICERITKSVNRANL